MFMNLLFNKSRQLFFPSTDTNRILSARILLLCLLGLSVGCGPNAKEIPAEPEAAIDSLVENLKAHQPQALWHAMPAKYQSDLREVIGAFCDHMDPKIYDRSMALTSKLADVLETKKDFFYNSPVALSTPFFDSMAGAKWDEVTALVRTFAESDLATIDRLRNMDPGDFLASTGAEIMDRSERLRLVSGKNNTGDPWQKLQESLDLGKMTFTETSSNQGLFVIQRKDEKEPTEVKMVKVEGRWVPVDMSQNWDAGIIRAKAGMKQLSGPEFQKSKPIIIFALTSFEGVLNQLLNATSQQQFDQTLLQMVQISQTLKSMAPKSDDDENEKE